MRKLLLCALALCAGCGDPVDAFAGSYSLISLEGTNSINGTPMHFGGPVPAGSKLTITRDTGAVVPVGHAGDSRATWVTISLSGKRFLTANVTSATSLDTLFESVQTQDTSCAYLTAFADGHSNGTLSGNVLEITLSAAVDAFCSPSPDKHGTATETLQATKDK